MNAVRFAAYRVEIRADQLNEKGVEVLSDALVDLDLEAEVQDFVYRKLRDALPDDLYERLSVGVDEEAR